jgi:hypothetical protein
MPTGVVHTWMQERNEPLVVHYFPIISSIVLTLMSNDTLHSELLLADALLMARHQAKHI